MPQRMNYYLRVRAHYTTESARGMGYVLPKFKPIFMPLGGDEQDHTRVGLE